MLAYKFVGTRLFQGQATVGEVGDRTIMTQSKSKNGRTTLRIVKTKLLKELWPFKLLDSNMDRIIYTEEL